MNGNLAYQEEPWREELIGGKVMAMAPASAGHTYAADNILMIFKQYLKGKKCIAFGDGLLVQLTKEDQFVPDVMVVCDRSKIKRTYIDGAPDLVVEVQSPSTMKRDRMYKKDVYEQCGVPEYWLVSTAERSIEVYLLKEGRFVLDNIYKLYSTEELEELSDEEKAGLVTEFKCHLYDDLVIRLEDIFDDFF